MEPGVGNLKTSEYCLYMEGRNAFQDYDLYKHKIKEEKVLSVTFLLIMNLAENIVEFKNLFYNPDVREYYKKEIVKMNAKIGFSDPVHAKRGKTKIRKRKNKGHKGKIHIGNGIYVCPRKLELSQRLKTSSIIRGAAKIYEAEERRVRTREKILRENFRREQQLRCR